MTQWPPLALDKRMRCHVQNGQMPRLENEIQHTNRSSFTLEKSNILPDSPETKLLGLDDVYRTTPLSTNVYNLDSIFYHTGLYEAICDTE